jgi:hypothetical protein
MIRNLKVLGLALVAMMAMTAVAASSASAVEFHSDSANTVITGTQTGNHVFDAAGSTITCKKASFTGTQEGATAAAVKVEATYGECTFFGVSTTVLMNNCRYEFKANGEVAVIDRVGVDCNTSPITFRASFLGVSCDVKIGEQANLKSVTYGGAKATEANGSITVNPAVTGIAYTAEGSGCSKTGAQTDGNYTSGPTSVKGFVDNAGAEGAQTPIWVL